MSKPAEVDSPYSGSFLENLIFGAFINGARRLCHIMVDPVNNRLVIDVQFTRYGTKGLTIQAHQDGFFAQIIRVAIEIWIRGVLFTTMLTTIALTARTIFSHLELFIRFQTCWAL